MIVGRETGLPSGAVDLVGIARNGAILVIRFKTGPQNSDFRHTLAQMVDYGSHLWEMDPNDFETTVARRYFATAHAGEASAPVESIAAAATATWPDLTDEELAAFTDGWHGVLASGGFHFVLVAQRFTPTITRTMRFMNQISQPARFCAVELVRFTGADLNVYEGRTVVRHDRPTTASRSAASTSEQRLLDKMTTTPRRAVEQLLAFGRGQGLVLEWAPSVSRCGCLTSPSRSRSAGCTRRGQAAGSVCATGHSVTTSGVPPATSPTPPPSTPTSTPSDSCPARNT